MGFTNINSPFQPIFPLSFARNYRLPVPFPKQSSYLCTFKRITSRKSFTMSQKTAAVPATLEQAQQLGLLPEEFEKI
ncbi:MAG: hypothetical protein AAF570_25975, partial [Bacteroidota bacterium]